MALLFGSLRGRRALAWLKHRRGWIFARSDVIESVARLEEDNTPRLTEDGIARITEGTI